jgi:Zn-dependent protease with chaperone function
MIILHGKYYDGQRSIQVDATLAIRSDGHASLTRNDDGTLIASQTFSTLKVSPRLADTPRFLTFSRGGSFETADNRAVDEALVRLRPSYWDRWVHRLETHLLFIIIAMVALILLGLATVKYGLPAAAKAIAAHLPPSAVQLAGEQTLTLLDQMVFHPSELPTQRKLELRKHLQQVLDSHPSQHIEVVFRKGDKVGANAFALPHGVIVFTDELVAMARHDDEISAVLVHEIGHQVHSHAMRRIVQDSLLSFAVLAITGDASGVSELFLGMPILLTELAYSRAFEREADRYALNYMDTHGIPTRRFTDLLSRIGDHNQWSGYFSTHPSTQERLEAIGGEGNR